MGSQPEEDRLSGASTCAWFQKGRPDRWMELSRVLDTGLRPGGEAQIFGSRLSTYVEANVENGRRFRDADKRQCDPLAQGASRQRDTVQIRGRSPNMGRILNAMIRAAERAERERRRGRVASSALGLSTARRAESRKMWRMAADSGIPTAGDVALLRGGLGLSSSFIASFHGIWSTPDAAFSV